jgi:LytR cell envelope-related transcriptional attenuator
MAAWSRSDERGQVVSSVVALAAVIAVVVGLLVLFGTGGTDGKSAAQPSTPPPPVPSPSDTATSVPASTTTPPPVTTQAPTPKPTTASSSTTIKTLEPSSEPTQPASTTRPATGPRPSIEIYNNTRERGLADRVSTRARINGWTVAGIDNWVGKVAASTVYYPPAMADHAATLAADLGVGRTKGALDNMKTDRLTVILTTDYTG